MKLVRNYLTFKIILQLLPVPICLHFFFYRYYLSIFLFWIRKLIADPDPQPCREHCTILIYVHFAGEYELVEESLSSLTRPADGRRFSLRVSLPTSPEPVEVAHVAVHGDYFSRRLMIKQAAGPASYHNLYAVAGTAVNVTRLCAVLVELYQLPSGKIDFDTINALFK